MWNEDLAKAVRSTSDPVKAVTDVITSISQELTDRLGSGADESQLHAFAAEVAQAAPKLARAAVAGTGPVEAQAPKEGKEKAA